MTLEQLNELIKKDEIEKVFLHLNKIQFKDNTFAQLQKEYIDGKGKEVANRLMVYLNTIGEERLTLPALAKPALNSKQEHAILDILREKSSKPALTTQEAAELYQLKIQIYKEFFENSDKKMAEHYPYVIFERLIAQKELEALEEMELRKFISEKKAHYAEKSMVVAALTLSLIGKFDETRLEILLDFVFQNEHQVWQRALVGLVLALRNRDKKISPDFKKRLQNLKAIPQIQEALYYMDVAYRNFQITIKDDRNSTKGLLEFFATKKSYPFFEKPQYWFLPFFPDNQAATTAIHQSKHNVSAENFMQLLSASTSVCNVDKYALCFHLDALSEVGGLEAIFDREQRRLQYLADTSESERKGIENSIFSLYFQDLYQFFTHYPQEHYRHTVLEQQNLYEKTLLDLLAEEIAKIRIEAQKHYDADNYLQAIFYYEQYTQLVTDNNSAWYNLGIAYKNLKNYEKAIECYEKAIKIKHDYDLAWFSLGIAYDYLKNYAKAVECYEKAIKIKHDYDLAWVVLGNAYDNLQNYEKAIESYQKAIEIKPDDDSAWYNLGIAYKNLKNYEKAIECYEKAIEIKPDYDSAWYNLGIAYKNLKNYEKAVESYQKAIEINPDKHEAWNNLGVAYAYLKNYEKAVESFQKAIEIKSDFDSAWYCLGCTFSLQKNKSQALHYLQEAIALNPKYTEMAKTDTDFEWLWEDEDFKALVA